jgi:flagellin-like protein
MNTAKPKVQNRKAVAPIIATLLLVAIAVVGGIIVFVWASGMFGSTAGTALPNAEAIQLIGYDARETSALTGLTTTPALTNTADQALKPGEFVVLKVRNTGTADIFISKVTIMGKDHTWDSDASSATDAPAADKFEIYSKTSTDVDSKAAPSIAPGEDARIAINLHTGLPNDITVSRNLQVKMKTEQGSAFNFFVVTGLAE